MTAALYLWLIAFNFSERYPKTLDTPAYDLKTGRLIYTEERYQEDQDNRPQLWRFVYKDPTRQTIVTRNVRFTKSRIKPDYRLEDKRDGYLEGAELNGKQIKVFARRKAGEAIKEKYLEVPEPAVVDAGFNFYILENWERLISGEMLHFNFVAPIELDYFKFRLYKDREFENAGRKNVSFNIDIDNFLLRLFVEPIRVTYDVETRRLMVYEGLSNINNEQGKSHRVRMVFSYQ